MFATASGPITGVLAILNGTGFTNTELTPVLGTQPKAVSVVFKHNATVNSHTPGVGSLSQVGSLSRQI
jgi:hypothetical protein